MTPAGRSSPTPPAAWPPTTATYAARCTWTGTSRCCGSRCATAPEVQQTVPHARDRDPGTAPTRRPDAGGLLGGDRGRCRRRGWLLTHPLEHSVGDPENDLARWFEDRRTPTLTTAAHAFTTPGDTLGGAGTRGPARGRAGVAAPPWRSALFVVLAVGRRLRDLRARVHARPPGPAPGQDPGPRTGAEPQLPVGPRRGRDRPVGAVAVLARAYLPGVARWLVPLLVLIPPLVLVSRLYLGAHHLSDTLVGMLFGLAWLAVLTLTLRPARRPSAQTVRSGGVEGSGVGGSRAGPGRPPAGRPPAVAGGCRVGGGRRLGCALRRRHATFYAPRRRRSRAPSGGNDSRARRLGWERWCRAADPTGDMPVAPRRVAGAGCGAGSLLVGRVRCPVAGDVGGAAVVAQELVAVR